MVQSLNGKGCLVGPLSHETRWYYVGRSFDVKLKNVQFGDIRSISVFPTLALSHSIVLEPFDRFNRNLVSVEFSPLV